MVILGLVFGLVNLGCYLFVSVLIDCIRVNSNYKYLQKTGLTTLTHDEFKTAYDRLCSIFNLNIGAFKVVYITDEHFVICLNHNYYSAENNGLILLFNERQLFESNIKEKLKMIRG